MRKEANSINLESCEVSSKSHTCLHMTVNHFGVASETILIGHTQNSPSTMTLLHLRSNFTPNHFSPLFIHELPHTIIVQASLHKTASFLCEENLWKKVDRKYEHSHDTLYDTIGTVFHKRHSRRLLLRTSPPWLYVSAWARRNGKTCHYAKREPNTQYVVYQLGTRSRWITHKRLRRWEGEGGLSQ